MNTSFARTADEFVVEKVRENFDFLTGGARPTPKKKGMTHVDGNTLEDHFLGGPSFLHRVIFFQAFEEAKRRALLNVVEVSLCEELVKELSRA